MKSFYRSTLFGLFIFFFCVTVTKAATVPSFDWVNTWGDSGLDYTADFITDADENIYLLGYFNNTVDFDPGAGTASVASVGSGDAYFSKFSSDGTFEWVKTWGGTGDDNAAHIVLGNDSAVFVVGRFQSTVDFDPGAGTSYATSSGGYDLYVSKFSSDGTFEWVKTWGGTGNESTVQIGFGQDGNIYILSSWTNSVDFDPDPITTASTTSNGGADLALSRFDSDGTFEWVKTWGGTGNDTVSIPLNPVFDANDSIYITGGFANTVDFDPGAGTSYATSSGSGDAYILKFSSDGTFEWVKTWGGTGDDASRSVVFDTSDGMYVGGYFANTVDFDPDAGVANATSNGSADAYLSKFSSDGTFEWVKTWGGTGFDFSVVSSIDADDAVYTRGDFAATVDFDPSSGTQSVVSNGASDSYVSRFTSDGTFEWVKTWGGTGSEFGSTLNAIGDTLQATGWFQNTVDFDPGADTSNKTSNGSWDAYLFSLDLLDVTVDISPATGNLNEATTDTFEYDIVLTAPPSDDVVITITPDDQVTTDVAEVTFASTTWDIPQTVTVSVVNDSEEEDESHTGTITHTSASDDISFNNLTIEDVTVTISEDDIPASNSGSHRHSSSNSNNSPTQEPIVTPTIPASPEILTPEERTVLIQDLMKKVEELKQELIKILMQKVEELQVQLAEMFTAQQ